MNDDNPAIQKLLDIIMRGVQVPAGEHEVVFRFTLTATTFYITLVSVFAALLLCGLIVMLDRRTGGTKMPGDNQPTT